MQIQKFLSKVANKQTNVDDYISSLAEVTTNANAVIIQSDNLT